MIARPVIASYRISGILIYKRYLRIFPQILLLLYRKNPWRTLAYRLLSTQVVEVHVRIAVMNTMTYLGMPVSVLVV